MTTAVTFDSTRPVGKQGYARRLPFMGLLRDPWGLLEPQLRADSVSKLVPLAGTAAGGHGLRAIGLTYENYPIRRKPVKACLIVDWVLR